MEFTKSKKFHLTPLTVFNWQIVTHSFITYIALH